MLNIKTLILIAISNFPMFCLGEEEELPIPRMVILGPTGAGKSTLANVLLGEDPDCGDCTFPWCPDLDSCTKETSYAVGKWLGSEDNFTIVDTPGFGDSDHDQSQLIDEMVDTLKNKVEGANCLIMLLNGENPRFDDSLQQMVREMKALFGDSFWEHVMIGVSHWAYDANSVNKRNHTGQDETWFINHWNKELEEKFHINMTLDAVFIDSYSQQDWNIDDEGQQIAFRRETAKLFKFAQEKDLFQFKSIQDVLEEVEELKAEVQWLNDVITENLTKLALGLEQLGSKVDQGFDDQNMNHIIDINHVNARIDVVKENFEESIAAMEKDHNDDVLLLNEDIASLETIHKSDVSNLKSNFTTDITNLKSEIDSEIIGIQDNLDLMNLAPLGSIIPWTPFPNRLAKARIKLPSGWVLCDGSVIAEGIWAGEKTPNLNDDGRFLRGSTESNVLELQESQVEALTYKDVRSYLLETHNDREVCDHYHETYEGYLLAKNSVKNPDFNAARCSVLNQVIGTSGSETYPKNVGVMYIMKIK